MNGIGSIPSPQTGGAGFENRDRLSIKLKPEVDRVRANPFYPEGIISRASDSPVDVFQAHLPGHASKEAKKVGTVLNTVA